MLALQWSNCLEYEFQIRKEALQLAREEGHASQAA